MNIWGRGVFNDRRCVGELKKIHIGSGLVKRLQNI